METRLSVCLIFDWRDQLGKQKRQVPLLVCNIKDTVQYLTIPQTGAEQNIHGFLMSLDMVGSCWICASFRNVCFFSFLRSLAKLTHAVRWWANLTCPAIDSQPGRTKITVFRSIHSLESWNWTTATRRRHKSNKCVFSQPGTLCFRSNSFHKTS